MTTTANSTNILPAISRSISHTEIVATTFIGQFSDLSTQLHELGADWDYTSVYSYYETMYDIYGTYCNSEFRINVVCVMPQY